MESILTSIKKLIGITEADDGFDTDIIIHINTAFMALTDLKVGPSTGFIITDSSAVWTDFISDPKKLAASKTYVYLRVKLLFDSESLSSTTIASMERQIDKLEWLLNVGAESNGSSIDDGTISEEIATLIADIETRLEVLEQGDGSVHTHANKDVLDNFGWNYTKTQPTFGGSTQSHVLATLDDVTSRVNYLKLDLEGQISLIPKFSIVVVDALPTTDINYSAIYLVRDNETEGDFYTAYVYIKGKWERLGSHTADVPTTEELVDAVIEALPKYEGEVSEV